MQSACCPASRRCFGHSRPAALEGATRGGAAPTTTMKEDAVEAACLRAALATDQLRGADALETARGHALDEIVASEETAVANMRICLEVFRDPLRDLLGRDEVLGRVLNELDLLEKSVRTMHELRLERAREMSV